jgi:hypothetical protein
MRFHRVAAAALVLAAALLTAAAVAAGVQRGSERRQVSEVIGRYAAVFAPAPPAQAASPASAGAAGAASATASAPASSAPASRASAHPAAPAPAAEKGDKPDKAQEERVQRICRRNVFNPPRPPKDDNFKAKLVGVLGLMAYFEGSQGQPVGQNFNGATIKAIGPDWVEVEYEGKTRRLNVFDGSGGGPSPQGPRGRGGPQPPMVISGGPPAGAMDEAQMRAMMEAARARAERMRASAASGSAASQP